MSRWVSFHDYPGVCIDDATMNDEQAIEFAKLHTGHEPSGIEPLP